MMGLISEWRSLAAVAATVVVINLAAILVCIATRKDRRKSTTVLMVSLLLSDMLFGAILIPVRIIDMFVDNSDIFKYIYAFILFLSAFNALFLSFDRYASVIRPLWRRLVSTRTIVKGIFVTWLLPAVISLLPLTWSYFIGYNSEATKIYSYTLLGLLCLVLCLVVLFQIRVLCGLFMYWTSSNKKGPLRSYGGGGRSQSRKEHRRKFNSTTLFLCLITTSVVTWLPTIIYNIRPFPELIKVSLFALMVNAVMDPLLILGFNAKAVFNRLRNPRRTPHVTQSTRSRFQLTVRNHIEVDQQSAISQM